MSKILELLDFLDEQNLNVNLFANMMRVKRNSVYRWLRGGPMTLRNAKRIEKITLGRLKVEDIYVPKVRKVSRNPYRN